MKIEFICQTNKGYQNINSAIFTLPSGAELTVDREKTVIDKSFKSNIGNMKMIWEDSYIWALDGRHIFTQEDGEGLKPHSDYEKVEFKCLLSGERVPATVRFEFEDEVDEDYVCDCLMYEVA